MSVILDALRKSEAERQRGQAPGLHNELPPQARVPPRTPSRWPWAIAIGLAALGLSALGVGWMLRPTPPAPTVATTAPPTVAAAPRTAPSQPVAPPTRAEPTHAPAPIPVAKVGPPPASTTPAAAVAAPPAPVATAPVVIEPPPAPASTLPPAPSAAPVVEADSDNAVRLADLPTAQREQLPALKISMHLWDAAPARRFAIIDGSRLAEGDRIGEAVVARITPGGVILDWHGQRLSLPIR